MSGYFPTQTDGFNCGLWALENAETLTRMADESKGPHWMVHQLQRSRGSEYFSERRRFLSNKLSEDPVRQQRLSQARPPISVQETDRRTSPISKTNDEPQAKKKKLVPEEKAKENLDFFVKFFIQAFVKRLGNYNLIAKGDRLTTEALRAELKTGFVGALWGATITQTPAGGVPSVVATVRNVGGRYFTPKKKAQKLTKALSEIKSGDLSKFLAEAGIEVFQSYEQQFMQISDKAGYQTAIDKVAEDAAGRALNYLDEILTPTTAISSETIALGIIFGKSETYFDPSLKKTRIRFTGNHIQNAEGHSFSTANLFEKVGVIIKSKNDSPDAFYKKNRPQSTLYGYRRLLSWEADSAGGLKASEQSNYISDNPSDLTAYDYQLNVINAKQEVTQLLRRMSISKVIIPSKVPPKNIIFNLRHPLKNFSGRSQALIDLHQLLSVGSKSAVVTHKMAELSLDPAERSGQPLQEGVQAAVSGLGGIGKTQLALQYAKQHPSDYDHNVLWIDSEKKIDIVESFKKLAIKLAIDVNDAYGTEKESDQLIEDVYDYFGSAKSLFIFDNVENAQEIEDILPKASSGNKPTVLITSRYSNWKNIATPLQLGVFSEAEAAAFIKTELSITGNTENAQISELNSLLQSLPLALQQAVAYINSEKTLDSTFSIQNYIERFKAKQTSQELLNFDLSQYSNDPYSKTILTTWEITLEKIKQEKVIGEKAIETLQIMAYLYPDNIVNSIFFQLPNNVRLSTAIHLLKAYSLINEGSEPHISTIHRLMQKVLRIKLERNRSEFEEVVQNIIYLTRDYTHNKETMSHYFSFLLHMLEHKELTQALNLQVTHRKILEIVTYYEDDKNLLANLFDSAHATLSREQYFDFIGQALVIYTRYPFIVSLMSVIDYMDQKINEGLISLDEAKFILDFKYTITREEYKDVRISSVPEIRARQLNAIGVVYHFEHKLFPNERDRICRRDRKRSINFLCSRSEDERLNQRLISATKMKAHIKKVRLVANLANFGLLTKDTLSALIQGDFESVAINFALLSSSRVLGKLSNKLLIKGSEQLALGAEKLLLQKELDYDGKVAASLFTDKEIMLAGKQRFLGTAMKAAAPFVAKGTAIFFAYNFVKGLSSNQTDLLDNLSNGAIVALDLGEAGVETAEYLGYIAGVSEVTGPIGEGIGFLIIGGMQLYHVDKELKAIEKWVHLSDREKFAEGMRAFFNFQPSEYLEAKANNHQLANKAIDFLKLHPDIQRYVFSAWLPATESAKKNFVFLDHQRNLTVSSDDIPEEPREGHLFCLPGIRARPHPRHVPSVGEQVESFIESMLENLLGLEEKTSYLCINAIGVEYSANRTGNATLVALQGDATVIGAHSDTVFLISDGNQDYRAGDADDLFILQGKRISGRLQGGLGVNIVKFSGYQPNAESVLLDSQGFLCGKNATTSRREEFCVGGLYLSNITQLHGRENKQDKIFPTQEVTVIDTYSGENAAQPDYIYITEKSSKNLTIAVRSDTVVQLLPRNISDNLIIYKVPVDQIGSASVQLPFNDETQHQFYFAASLENVKALSVKNNTISFQLSYPDGRFNLTIQNTEASLFTSNTTTERPFFLQSAAYIFNKNLGMKLLNEKTLYFQWYGNNSIDEIIQFAAPIAHRIDKAMVIQTSKNETIAIGGRQQEILSTDGLVVNHLVGNAGDAVYLIQTPRNSTNPFPLNDISLYKLEDTSLITSTTTDTLDLRQLVKKAQELCGKQNISYTINEDNHDLIITLHTKYYPVAADCLPSTQTNNRIAQILLKKALIDDWYQDVDIIWDEHPMNIIFDQDDWRFVDIRLTIPGNKNVIAITDKDIRQNDEIVILKNRGEYGFRRHNGTDLLLTNMFNNVTEAELYTVLFSQFFQNSVFKEKILSLNLTFLDEPLSLREYVQEISNATDFDLQIQSYFNNTSLLNQSAAFFSDATISRPRTRRDITESQPIASGGAKTAAVGAYDLFTYIPSKILQFVGFILNSFNSINNFDLSYRLEEVAAWEKMKRFIVQPPEKINLPVYCNKNNIFAEEDCVKNQSSLGLLGYCVNPKHGVTWFIKNTGETNIPSLSWFALAYNGIPANTSANLDTLDINLSTQADRLYFYNKDGCLQAIHLSKMSNTSLATLPLCA